MRGEQPNASRLLMNEYNNLSEKFELGYVIRKDPVSLWTCPLGGYYDHPGYDMGKKRESEEGSVKPAQLFRLFLAWQSRYNTPTSVLA